MARKLWIQAMGRFPYEGQTRRYIPINEPVQVLLTPYYIRALSSGNVSEVTPQRSLDIPPPTVAVYGDGLKPGKPKGKPPITPADKDRSSR